MKINKNYKSNKIFIDELKRTFPIYILGMVFHAIVIYILYKIPSIIGNILDLLLEGNTSKDVIMHEVYSLIFYSIIMIIPRIIYRTLFFTRARVSDTYLRSKVIEHLQTVKPEYYDKEDKGVFLAYLSKEILSIRKFFGNAFFNVARLIVAPIIGLIVIGKNFNIILMLSILPIFPIAIYFLYKLYKKQGELLEKERKVYIDLSKNIEQNTSGFSLIKLYNEQENQREKFDKVNEETYKSDVNVGAVIYKMDMVSNVLYAACYSIGFAVGLLLINKGLLTIGELTAYISCITIAISEIVNSIEPLLTGISNFKIASRRFNYFFGLDTYKKDGKKLEKIDKIEIKNLCYSYENNEELAIDNINMTINKGEKIGIVGKVGSGKTTLMNIIAGFYEVPENKVYINGIDINEYSRESIFDNIGYSMQKNIITDDTIKNNIDIVNEKADREIEQISEKANILEDINTMRDGFETKIGENGIKISGGQKQRIQIARNLLNVRNVNIFDDALSALDIDTEKKVLEEIEKQIGDNILILISNKISMMKKMDKVFLLVEILFFIIVYTSIHLGRLIFKYIRDVLINKTICKILRDIRKTLFDKILNFKMITFNKYNSSELYTRLTSDVDNLFDLFFGFLYDILSNILYIVFMIVMMFVANIHLAIIGGFTVVLISIIVYKFTKVLGNLDNEILKKRDMEHKEFSELYNKNKLTYLFKLQNKNVNKMNDLFYSELKIRRKYIFIHHFPYWIIAMIQAIGIYAIIYYALNINVSISLGSIYLVLYYTKECKTPLEEICNQLEELQTCINSYKRIKVLLNETEEENIESGDYIENLNGDIEFQNVSMKYDKEMILKNMSFVIKKGTKVTIAGRTGVGKTTLTNVLMKLYDIESGKILIDNYDISKISTKCLRDNISYISQNPYIFTDTVRNNITLGNKEITDVQINQLIQEMGVENLFKKLADGLDTKIKLSKLSYGELQIIAFIRAILHKANLYIFDEPTSNIDLQTEKMIQNIIDKISQKSTVIIIAHRKSTIESSDKIIYLKDGQIDMIVNKELV